MKWWIDCEWSDGHSQQMLWCREGAVQCQEHCKTIARPLQDHCKTIARLRNELGWTYKYSCRHCHVIWVAKKLKWVNRCKQRIDEKDTFDDVIFTAESTIQCHHRKCFWKYKMPRKLKYMHKHQPKIHVWGGILKQGATQLVMFNSIMNATKYGDILSGSRELFWRSLYLYHDNDPQQSSKYIQRLITYAFSIH